MKYQVRLTDDAHADLGEGGVAYKSSSDRDPLEALDDLMTGCRVSDTNLAAARTDERRQILAAVRWSG